MYLVVVVGGLTSLVAGPPDPNIESKPGEGQQPAEPAGEEEKTAEPETAKPDTPPAEAEKPLDFPGLLRALGESSNPNWSDYYRPPVGPKSDRTLGALALGGVIADIYLASEGYDKRQVKNLCMEVESHSGNLGINTESAEDVRNLSEAAGAEKWEEAGKATEVLRAKLAELLVKQRDSDLATLVDVGFWLRALEITSGVIQADKDAKNLQLCIACPGRLQGLMAKLDGLGEGTKKQPAVVEIQAELGRLERRWTDTEGTRTREDVEASHVKVRNLLKRLFE